jgi:hypothetical protein
LRFVFFAVFAAFFLRFAMVPSRVLRDGVIERVQSRIDLHYTSITTQQRKNQLCRLRKRLRERLLACLRASLRANEHRASRIKTCKFLAHQKMIGVVKHLVFQCISAASPKMKMPLANDTHHRTRSKSRVYRVKFLLRQPVENFLQNFTADELRNLQIDQNRANRRI